jgi:hypothetical protein
MLEDGHTERNFCDGLLPLGKPHAFHHDHADLRMALPLSDHRLAVYQGPIVSHVRVDSRKTQKGV